MRRNDVVDFSIPRRQSYIAILFFIYRFFKILIRQVWPLLLAFLFGRENLKTTLLIIIAVVSFLTLVYSIISFFRYFFYVRGQELVVEKGIFQRSKTNIPFERIQTIHFEQTLLHQLFDVVKLEVDTAGSKGNEFSFAALSKKVAAELRQTIMEEKARLQTLSPDGPTEDESPVQREQIIFKLSLWELIRIGLVQNHLRSFFLIVVFFTWIIDQLREIGMSPDEMLNEMDPRLVNYGLTTMLYFALAAIVISLLISMARTVLRYYELRLIRTQDGFKIESGLLNRKQVSARDHKIQLFGWADNPLKRFLGLFDVSLRQASSVSVGRNRAIVIPGCDRQNLERIRSYYFKSEEWAEQSEFGVSKIYRNRQFLFMGFWPVVISFLSLYFWVDPVPAWFVLSWLPVSFVLAQVSFRKKRIGVNEHVLVLHRGLFGNNHRSLKIYKIQNVTIEQGLYQRIRGLADLTIFTASGAVSVPYLPLELAEKLMDYLIWKTEIDKRKWM